MCLLIIPYISVNCKYVAVYKVHHKVYDGKQKRQIPNKGYLSVVIIDM